MNADGRDKRGFAAWVDVTTGGAPNGWRGVTEWVFVVWIGFGLGCPSGVCHLDETMGHPRGVFKKEIATATGSAGSDSTGRDPSRS